MRDLESERQQRQEALQLKRDELKAWESQLSTTNHHRGQLDQAINRAKAISAVQSESTPGVFPTAIPRSVAAAISI